MSDEELSINSQRQFQDLLSQSSLGTQRARQIRTIGHNRGKFTDSDLMELCLDFLTDRGSSLSNYREDLGNGVERYFRIEERDDEAGYLEVEVRFTHDLNLAGPDARYRIHLRIESLEP